MLGYDEVDLPTELEDIPGVPADVGDADRRTAAIAFFATVVGLYIAMFQAWLLDSPRIVVVSTLAAIGYFALQLMMVGAGWIGWASWKRARRSLIAERQELYVRLVPLASLERTLQSGSGIVPYADAGSCMIDQKGRLRLAGFVLNGQPQTVQLKTLKFVGAGIAGARVRGPVLGELSSGRALPGSSVPFSVHVSGLHHFASQGPLVILDTVRLELEVDCGAGSRLISAVLPAVAARAGVGADPATLVEPPRVAIELPSGTAPDLPTGVEPEPNDAGQ